MKIVVTGGAGFIGSHIVDAYIEQGHEVTIIDDISTGDKRNLNKQAALCSMDILDPKIPGVLSDISPDVLCHHAAQMDVRRSVADPKLDARINILGLIHLLEGCKGAGVKKVIFASSGGAVYGEQEKFPAPENHTTQPASPYGVSKITGEYYLSFYKQAAGIPYVALRYGNVYGPRQLATGEAGVVAIFIGKFLRGESPTINGDGKQTRDYVYVGDVVRANLMALESDITGPVNIGTGKETDVVTIFDLLNDKMGAKKKAVFGPAKPGEQRRSCLDVSHARKALGWSPKISFNAGLDQTISFYRERDAS